MNKHKYDGVGKLVVVGVGLVIFVTWAFISTQSSNRANGGYYGADGNWHVTRNR